MALQKNIILKNGLQVPESYHRIGDIRLDRELRDGTSYPVAYVCVNVFKNQEARTDGLPTIFNHFFDISDKDTTQSYTDYLGTSQLDATGNNILSQTYEYMKTQSNISGVDYTDSTNV